MKIRVYDTAKQLGEAAACYTVEILKKAIAERGSARIVLSTGMSQFETLEALIKTDVDWSRVEMFHLDEYIGLPVSHKASFHKYLNEKFISKVHLKAAHLVGNSAECIPSLSDAIRKSPIDVGLIGIGENAHIAFNDPPADFHSKEAYLVVDLPEACKNQQVGEGWFPTVNDVPKQAISMSVHQIMQCRHIVSCVPHRVKAAAIRDTLESGLTNTVPATMLKEHKAFTLFLDANSSAFIDQKKIQPSAKDTEYSFESFVDTAFREPIA